MTAGFRARARLGDARAKAARCAVARVAAARVARSRGAPRNVSRKAAPSRHRRGARAPLHAGRPAFTTRTCAPGWLILRTKSLAWDDPDYPQRCSALADPPLALFFVGRRELLNRPALAIVGSRNATPQGMRQRARVRAGAVRCGPHHRIGARARHRRRRARGRARRHGRARIAVIGTGPIAFIPRATAHSRMRSPHAAHSYPSFRRECRRCAKIFRAATG